MITASRGFINLCIQKIQRKKYFMTIQIEGRNNTIQPAKYKIKAGLHPLTVIEIHHFDAESFEVFIQNKINEAPTFFDQAPIVLSFEHAPDHKLVPLEALVGICKLQGIYPVAVIASQSHIHEQAKTLQLPVLPNSKTKLKNVSDTKTSEAAAVSSITAQTNKKVMIIDKPVRSGQQVYARDSDLIILSMVSAGAEVLADGNIHIYGPLRGRALAGIQGNSQACIVCNSLEAELISIAGHYKLNEDLSNDPSWQASCIVRLDASKLTITKFNQ